MLAASSGATPPIFGSADAGAFVMLKFLFGGLTAQTAQGEQLFAALTRQARARHWYRKGKIPDTLDGRFAMLATISALAMLRLEALGDAGNRLSVALTERFVEVMESEHRELGIGDPKLGRTVRKLVGGLARRIEIWRPVVAGEQAWAGAVKQSLPAGDEASAYLERALRTLWAQLGQASRDELREGSIW